MSCEKRFLSINFVVNGRCGSTIDLIVILHEILPQQEKARVLEASGYLAPFTEWAPHNYNQNVSTT